MEITYHNLIQILLFTGLASSFKVNITKFGNCPDITENVLPVELQNIEYIANDEGIVDTIRGNYDVRSKDTRVKELNMTIFQCKIETTGQCNNKPNYFIETLHCDRFKSDNSGPWYMIANGMSESKCGESEGHFVFNTQFKPEYLINYLQDNSTSWRYRMQMLFHKKGEAVDDVHIRGCVNVEFNLLN